MADNDHTIIQDLKADERPRARLIKHGPPALRTAGHPHRVGVDNGECR